MVDSIHVLDIVIVVCSVLGCIASIFSIIAAFVDSPRLGFQSAVFALTLAAMPRLICALPMHTYTTETTGTITHMNKTIIGHEITVRTKDQAHAGEIHVPAEYYAMHNARDSISIKITHNINYRGEKNEILSVDIDE